MGIQAYLSGSKPEASRFESEDAHFATVTGTGIPLRLKTGGLKVRLLLVAPCTPGAIWLTREV